MDTSRRLTKFQSNTMDAIRRGGGWVQRVRGSATHSKEWDCFARADGRLLTAKLRPRKLLSLVRGKTIIALRNKGYLAFDIESRRFYCTGLPAVID